MVKLGATCCEREGPTADSISFLLCSIKDLGFRRIILKCDSEPSTKSLQDAVIEACAGVEVVPPAPFEGDHMGQWSFGGGCARSETTVQNTSEFS